ncbi:squalene synthase HpnC [Massilia sp. W12]|uniref:squalene synthase HpnC n=1 Tax=Massilia sp. W12 TaxID=3126507 RepID=UPI0030CFFBFC
MPVEHYENFPVASFLLPARLRSAVEAVYAFARSADDIADEGMATPQQRLAALQHYEAQLQRIAAGASLSEPLFIRLAQALQAHQLPIAACHALLSAFMQDVQIKRYASHAQVLDYCARSANPVGCLMLHLYQAATPHNLTQSDAICSALQIINFLQDIGVDLEKDRIYLPQEQMAAFGLSEEALFGLAKRAPGAALPANFIALMQAEIARVRNLMLSGADLALRLPGRIGWELRLVVQGGLRILEKIEANQYDVFQRRPKLGKPDWLLLIWRAMRMRAQA